MKSEILSKIKNKLKPLLSNKKILDIIVFGSVVKGKSTPADIDIAIITEEQPNFSAKEFHISVIKPSDFFKTFPTIATTILREGYSLRHNCYLAEALKFKNGALFTYELVGLSPSKKVQTVRFLRGNSKEKGLVKENKGEWLANQVFYIPIESSYLIEKFFINSRIKFKKSFVLMH